MQRQLNRMRRRKRVRRRFLVVTLIALLVAMAAVSMRACTDSFRGPYNKGYQPMDEERVQNPGRNP